MRYSTLPPDTEPQTVDDDSTAPALIPEPDDVPDVIIEGGVQLVVDVASNGTVGVECADECAYSGERYWSEPGQMVTVKAIPDEGYLFGSWNCVGVSCPIDTEENPIRLLLYNEVELTASFLRDTSVELPYGLVVENPSLGGVAVASCHPDCLYDSPPRNTSVFIEAFADVAYELEGWLCEGTNCFDADSGRPIDLENRDNPVRLTLNDSKTRLMPVFKASSLVITETTSRNGLLSLTPEEEQMLVELWGIEGDSGKIEFVLGAEEGAMLALTPEQEQILVELWKKREERTLGGTYKGLGHTLELLAGEFTVTPGRGLLSIGYARVRRTFTAEDYYLVSLRMEEFERLPLGEPIRDPADLMKMESGEYGRVNYVVINDASYGGTDTYRQIVRDAILEWESLNPWLDFREVDSEKNPELDLLVRFIDSDVFQPGSRRSGGRFCPSGCGFFDELDYGEILMGATYPDNDTGSLSDENVNFCVAQGHLPGQPGWTFVVVKHELGHFLGLDHHRLESHLMFGGISSRVTDYDTLGYSIPELNWDWFADYGAVPVNVGMDLEEVSEISDRISFLERILQGNYEVPEDARGAEVEHERLVIEMAALEQELVRLNIRLKCGEMDPEYTG